MQSSRPEDAGSSHSLFPASVLEKLNSLRADAAFGIDLVIEALQDLRNTLEAYDFSDELDLADSYSDVIGSN